MGLPLRAGAVLEMGRKEKSTLACPPDQQGGHSLPPGTGGASSPSSLSSRAAGSRLTGRPTSPKASKGQLPASRGDRPMQ